MCKASICGIQIVSIQRQIVYSVDVFQMPLSKSPCFADLSKPNNPLHEDIL